MPDTRQQQQAPPVDRTVNTHQSFSSSRTLPTHVRSSEHHSIPRYSAATIPQARSDQVEVVQVAAPSVTSVASSHVSRAPASHKHPSIPSATSHVPPDITTSSTGNMFPNRPPLSDRSGPFQTTTRHDSNSVVYEYDARPNKTERPLPPSTSERSHLHDHPMTASHQPPPSPPLQCVEANPLRDSHESAWTDTVFSFPSSESARNDPRRPLETRDGQDKRSSSARSHDSRSYAEPRGRRRHEHIATVRKHHQREAGYSSSSSSSSTSFSSDSEDHRHYHDRHAEQPTNRLEWRDSDLSRHTYDPRTPHPPPTNLSFSPGPRHAGIGNSVNGGMPAQLMSPNMNMMSHAQPASLGFNMGHAGPPRRPHMMPTAAAGNMIRSCPPPIPPAMPVMPMVPPASRLRWFPPMLPPPPPMRNGMGNVGWVGPTAPNHPTSGDAHVASAGGLRDEQQHRPRGNVRSEMVLPRSSKRMARTTARQSSRPRPRIGVVERRVRNGPDYTGRQR